MYLSSVKITNFRSCYETNVNFSPALTLMVGENNCGKSNIIEALRLATTPQDKKHARWFERDDVAWGREGQSILIDTNYKDLTNFQKGQYITAYDLSCEDVDYQTRFLPNTDDWRRSTLTHLAGKMHAAESEPEQREKIRHVYLPPLRDVHRELDSYDGHRISRIIELLSDKSEVEDLINSANVSMSVLDSHPVVSILDSRLQSHLTPLTRPFHAQHVKTGFQEEKSLHKLVRNLRIRMAEVGLDPTSLSSTGMGYANLVFIAMVILELESAKENELTLFLVEEPEAHLHPQLQVVLLDYLRQHAENSMSEDDSDNPAGRIQVIATTHSPNLASVTSIENIIVVNTGTCASPADESSEENSSLSVLTTKSLAIKDLGLPPDDVRKINQYLDVTRSSLLFARSVLLVEGTSEAVLMPVLAKHAVFEGASDIKDYWSRQFLGVTVISVGSVDFKPYIRLLLTKNDIGISIASRLTVLTDGDPDLGQSDDDIDVSVSNRIEDMRALSQELGAEDIFQIYNSDFTFEADLFAHQENFALLKTAFTNQHSRSQVQWETIIHDSSPAQFFYRKLRNNRKYLSKGEFAHDLAIGISGGAEFVCPDYIKSAIKNSVMYDSTLEAVD